ncbi:MAG: ribosome maturation factor RimP, partial [Oscillospiraceae bacterium]
MAEVRGNIAEFCERLAETVAEELGLEIWDVRYEKEGSGWFLRFFIDRENGVNIEDCENFSRRIEPILDIADPIEASYCLEVSSPGIERELRRPAHFAKYIGQRVTMMLIRPMEGIREITGTLVSHVGGVTTVSTPQGEFSATKKQIAYVRL